LRVITGAAAGGFDRSDDLGGIGATTTAPMRAVGPAAARARSSAARDIGERLSRQPDRRHAAE